jgi:hypothetical protein
MGRRAAVGRSAGLALAGWALAGLAVAAPAHAHGLVRRANLPIPEWLFGTAAAAVMVVSFVALAVLWSRPKLERERWRPLPGGLGRLLASRGVDILCGAIGVALLALVVVAGYVGPQDPVGNLAPTFILIIFWVGVAFASVVFGDIFSVLSPWRAVGRASGWALARARGGRAPRRRPYPERWGRWPAAVGLLAFTWIELASGWGEQPAVLVTVALVYSAVTWAGMAVYGVDTWSRNGEAFAVYFNLLARLSVFERRDGQVVLRPPLGGLPTLERSRGTVAFVVVMIGTVTFDGLSQGALWRDVGGEIDSVAGALAGAGTDTAAALRDTVGLLLAVAFVGAFYWLGIRGARTVSGEFGADRLRRIFIHSLVPIAAVYVAAHYLTFLLFEGQAIRYLAADPLGQGWNLFGWSDAGIDYGLLSQEGAWYLQVALVVAGHVAALLLAHDRALAVYGQPGAAVRSQYWMLGIMVGFTMLALWLLAQAGAG